MIIKRSKTFKKQYKKLPENLQAKFDERLLLFVQNSGDPRLRNHPLKDSYGGYWSIDVSGDLRALYRKVGEEIIIFGLIGTHSQLYG